MDRACDLALRAGLVAVAAVAAYAWALRAGSDLAWDEAFNLRVYARHPLTAVALYEEHNNHPLESVLKSFCVRAFGGRPPAARIAAFFFVAAHLAMAWALFRRMSRRGDVLAATVLVLLMLFARGISYQGMELRGYFLSSVLELAWFLMLARDTDLFRAPDGPDPAPRPWTWRTAVRYGVLAGLIVFTLPSNLLVLPAFWVLTACAWRGPSAAVVRRGAQLACTSVASTVLFYAPIVAAQALGYGTFHNSEARPVEDAAKAILDELALAARQLSPRGVPEEAFGWALIVLTAATAAWAFRPRARLARVALLVAAAALGVRVAFAAFVAYPERTRTAQVAPLLIAAVLAVQAIAASWSRRVQTIAALALVAASFVSVREIVAEAGPYRTPSDVAAFLQTACRPESRSVLVVTDNLRDPLEAVVRALGRERFVSSQSELDARLRGVARPARLPPGTLGARLRDWIAPTAPALPLDLAPVEALVIVDDDTRSAGASSWRHPALEELKARLPRRSEFRRDEFRIIIFEGSAGR